MERTEGRKQGRELPVYAIRLRELRHARGMSSRRVSEFCGMSHGMVGFYESGMKEPKASALITLADFYGVSVDYILGLEPE
jgi:transcriptional regulator with XRE-family HTH domain